MADEKQGKEEMSEDELDQIIQDMSKDEEAGETEAAASAPKAAPALELVQGAKKKGGSSSQALTLEMNGVVNLKLCFKNGERSIEVHCTEEHLLCRMADGTEFKIPTGVHKARKSA